MEVCRSKVVIGHTFLCALCVTTLFVLDSFQAKNFQYLDIFKTFHMTLITYSNVFVIFDLTRPEHFPKVLPYEKDIKSFVDETEIEDYKYSTLPVGLETSSISLFINGLIIAGSIFVAPTD